MTFSRLLLERWLFSSGTVVINDSYNTKRTFSSEAPIFREWSSTKVFIETLRKVLCIELFLNLLDRNGKAISGFRSCQSKSCF